MKDELNQVLDKANFDELVELANILSFENKDNNKIKSKYFYKQNELISDIDYWIRYYGESSLQKVSYKGSGIPYVKILIKVAKVLKLKISSNPTVNEIENRLMDFLIEKLPEDTKKKMEEDIEKDRLEYLKNTGLSEEIKDASAKVAIGTGVKVAAGVGANLAAQAAARQAAIAAGLGGGKAFLIALFTKGFAGIAAKKAAQQAALQAAARFGLLRTILAPIAGPIGIGLLITQIGGFIFGESYKKIIPVSIMIAQLRVLQEVESEMVGF